MPQGKKEHFQLKNIYNEKSLKELSVVIKKHYRNFNEKSFLETFKTKNWKQAELKARVRIITESLYEHLPSDYQKALEILTPASSHVKWSYFGIFFPDYVECYGLDSWGLSMKALKVFTQSSSGEFAIRPFIEANQDKAFKEILKWSKDKNHHIRRLSSEGCRPRLPWGKKLNNLIKDPSPIMQILDNLKDDPELYVRKSVANNLNDISKDHPDLVLKLAKAWIGKSENTDWIIKHGLRTLLKKGDKRALKLFGHGDTKGLEVKELKLNNKEIKLGEKLEFNFTLTNTNNTSREVRVEYAIHYQKKGDKLSKKVFQLKKLKLSKGEIQLRSTQRFQDFTTRKHYAGAHVLEIIVNGEVMSDAEFKLKI